MTWTCASCGGENPDGMRFCGHCGTAATAPIAPSSEPGSPPQQGVPADEADAGAEALRSFVTHAVADRLIESGGRLAEERRLVTALFADLSGFTPLAERLDPEELLEVIDPMISGLSDIVGRYDGFVEKFAGDALLALFGAPVAHEDDAVRAVLVAGEMHREVARLRETLGPDASDLTLHVGVNTGHGVARMIGSSVRLDYAVLGDAVILAQRLESQTPPGETYLGETTYRLVRDRFQLDAVGPLSVKGKAEPVPAWRVLDYAVPASAPSAPGRSTPFVGRRREVAAVRSAVASVEHGERRTLLISGEAGAGKSRLAGVARDLGAERGFTWLEARCISYGAAIPYWPYADLVRRLAGIDSDADSASARDRLSAIASADTPYLARLLGLPLLPGEGGEEPEAFRRGLHAAVSQLILRQPAPVCLALEDLHWADASSLELTAELAREAAAHPLLLLATSRGPAGDLDWTAAIELGPFDENATAELAGHVLGGEAPAQLLPVLAERGGGNPFFIEETVRTLVEGRALLERNARWRLRAGWEAAVPPTIEGVLATRLDALPGPVQAVVESASVIGRRVRLPLLRAVSPDADVEQAVEALLAARLVERSGDDPEGAVVFQHALVVEVAYERILRRRRRALHLRVAKEAQRLYGSGEDVIGLLARHLYLGAAGAEAVPHLVAAGERAAGLFATEEAIVHYRRAVELAEGGDAAREQLPELLVRLADLFELRGDYDEARERYERARDLSPDVRAWRGIASTLRRQGRYADSLAVVDAAFRSLQADADSRSLWLERGWSLLVEGRSDAAAEAFTAGLQHAAAEDALTGHLLLQLTRAELALGRLDDALEHGTHARALLEREGDRRGQATALRVIGGVYDDRGELDRAAATLREALAAAERVGSIEEIGGSLVNLGLVEMKRGNLDVAIECDRRAISEFERVGHASGRVVGYSNLAEKLMLNGDLDEAEHEVARAAELARQLDDLLTLAEVRLTAAGICQRRGAHAEAAGEAEAAAELYLRGGTPRFAATALELAAEAWRVSGDEERGSAAADRARSLATG